MVYDEPDLTIQRSQKRELRPLLRSFRDRNGCDGAPDADYDPESEAGDECRAGRVGDRTDGDSDDPCKPDRR